MSEVKGFKVFKPDWTCRDKKYTCPGRFTEDVDLELCGRGMHFCLNITDCFNYYSFDSNNRVAEVIAHGEVVFGDDKCCTNDLEIIREIPWNEVLQIVNIGKDCTGLSNTGNRNTGDYNTGNRNTGNRNTGNRNTGNRNTGDYNTGDYNTGNRNTGDYNTGDYNTGDYNTGDWNTGDWNTGDYNTGNCNTGDYNTGNCNTGDYNTGNCNTGDYNTGDCNTGDYNTGNCNTGDYNTGNCNTGDYNTGDWNTTSFSSGVFNTEEAKILIFNKYSDWSYGNWLDSNARYLLNQIPKDVVEWVWSSDMTDEEKAEYPTHETTGGYLKILDKSECGQIWWDGLSDSQKKIIRNIPNYDKEIFEEITGIKTE